MANNAHAATYALTAHLFDGFAALKDKIAARYAHYRTYHSSVNELRKLSDRDLHDLGLNRAMLKSVALEAADKQAKR